MNPAAQTATAPSTQQRRLALILFNVCVGQFIVGLDQRALLVALPTLTRHFQYQPDDDSVGFTDLRFAADRHRDHRRPLG